MCSLFEPVGEILHAALLLTEYIYLYGNKHNYTDHWIWFSLVSSELKTLCLEIPDTKSAKVDDLRKITAALKDGVNPFPMEFFPHLFRLIESAYSLSSTNAQHRQNTLKYLNLRDHKKHRYGLIYAIAWLAGELDKRKEIVAMSSDHHAIWFDEGRGQGKARITKAEISKIHAQKKQSPKTSPSKDSEA